MSTTMAENSPTPPKAMNITLWIVQILLAVMFGMAGAMKVITPIDALAQQMGWPGTVPEPLVRFIGVSELAGAFGLILLINSYSAKPDFTCECRACRCDGTSSSSIPR